MYLEYFGLSEKPFQITPDPRFLYMSRRHRDGFAHLLYGADEAGGFVLLTGEVGTGKTTLCRSALASITENVRVALILNPKQSAIELVASICDELQINYPKNVRSLKALIDRLNLYLLKAYGQGQRIVVVIDEAQNLTFEVLEQIRLLTNLEVSTQKLLQIILIGQPELQTMLSRPELRQLAQRITARFHLTPLTREETGEYIVHRLKVAGVTREIFTKPAVREIYRLSSGIPRLINTLSERALIGAYGANLPLIKKDIVSNAAAEVLGKSARRGFEFSWLGASVVTTAVLILAIGLWGILLSKNDQNNSTVANAANGDVQFQASEPVINNSDATSQTALMTQPEDQKTIQSEFSLLVNNNAGIANTTSAFSSLFSLWSRDYTAYSGNTACTRATNAGMRCIFGQGELELLTQFNRPAVVEIRSTNEVLVYAVLNEINGDQANLTINTTKVGVPVDELKQVWTGNYVIFWKPPFPNNESLAKGFIGPDVLWLRHQLDQIEGKKKAEYSAANLQFDDKLAERVTAFQQRYGLEADGIVGRETFIALANVDASNTAPKLIQATKG